MVMGLQCSCLVMSLRIMAFECLGMRALEGKGRERYNLGRDIT